jgi:hypothetical protein
MYFQGVGTGLDDYTYFMSGATSFPRDQLTKKQRFLALGPSCEVNGIHWLGVYDWMYRYLGLNDPEKSVMIGIWGQINGDYEHRHELALEVFQHELENRVPGGFLPEVIWKTNWVMATQFDEVNYGRGSTLFANGLIRCPRGQYSTTSVEAPPPPEPKGRVMWSVANSHGHDIHFAIDQNAKVQLDVYAVTGAHISTIINGETLGAGKHLMTWYGRTTSGNKVPSGIYFAQLTFHDSTGQHKASEKMVVVR